MSVAFSNTLVTLTQAANLVFVLANLRTFHVKVFLNDDSFYPKWKMPNGLINYVRRLRKPRTCYWTSMHGWYCFPQKLFLCECSRNSQEGMYKGKKNTEFPSCGFLFSLLSRRQCRLFRDWGNKSWVVGSRCTRDSGVSNNRLELRACLLKIMLKSDEFKYSNVEVQVSCLQALETCLS